MDVRLQLLVSRTLLYVHNLQVLTVRSSFFRSSHTLSGNVFWGKLHPRRLPELRDYRFLLPRSPSRYPEHTGGRVQDLGSRRLEGSLPVLTTASFRFVGDVEAGHVVLVQEV